MIARVLPSMSATVCAPSLDDEAERAGAGRRIYRLGMLGITSMMANPAPPTLAHPMPGWLE